MKVPNPIEGEDIRLTTDDLRQVFAYSPQHRTVISAALNRAMPDMWLQKNVDEDTFYQRLHGILSQSNSLSVLVETFNFLRARKNKRNWDELLNPWMRIFRVAINEFGFPNAKKGSLKEEEVREFYDQLKEDGHPAFGWMLDWLEMNWPKGGRNLASCDDEQAFAGSDSSDICSAWKAELLALSKAADYAAELDPNDVLLKELVKHTSTLEVIVARFDAIRESEADELADQAESILAALESHSIEDVRAVAENARAVVSGIRGDMDALAAWIGRMEPAIERYEIASEEHQKNTAELELAVDRGDYSVLGKLGEVAERSKAEKNDALAEISAASTRDAQTETTEPPSIRPLSEAEDNSVRKEEAAGPKRADETAETVPVAPVATPTESASLGLTDHNSPPAAGEPDASIVSEIDEDRPSQSSLKSPSETSPDTTVVGGRNPLFLLDRDWSSCDSVENWLGHLFDATGNLNLEAASALVWALLREDRVPLAYHLSSILSGAAPLGTRERLLPGIILAVHLSRGIRSGAGEAVLELAPVFNQTVAPVLVNSGDSLNEPAHVLAFAASVVPALFALDTTGARAVISSLQLADRVSRLHDLREFILSPSFYFSALLQQGESAALDSRLASARAACVTWWEDNRHRTYKYKPATSLWRLMLDEEGPLGSLLKLVANDSSDALTKVRKLLQSELQQSSTISALIDKQDKLVRARWASLKPIEAGPRTDMIARIGCIAEHLSGWVEAKESRVAVKGQGFGVPLTEVREQFLGLVNDARAQLAALSASDTLKLQSAAFVASQVLARLSRLFDANEAFGDQEPPWWQSLNAEILHVDDIPIDEVHWTPNWSAVSVEHGARAVMQVVSGQEWRFTYDEAERRCDHARTARLLEWFRAGPVAAGDDLDELELARDRSVQRCRKKLKASVDGARSRIESAVVQGYLNDSDRSKMLAALEDVIAADTVDFASLFQRVDDISRYLETGREQLINEMRTRLDEYDLKADESGSLERIRCLLERGDVLTANEYLALLDNDQELPDPRRKRESPLSNFFPVFVEEITEGMRALQGGGGRKVVEAIAKGKSFGPVDMRNVPGAQAKAAGVMVAAWYALKQVEGGRASADSLRDFFENLGMRVQEVERFGGQSNDDTYAWFQLRAQEIADRDICIVPRYGSAARGSYRVLCVWRRPSEDEVLSVAQAGPGSAPLLVLYFGQMTTRRRRDLAFRSRERRQTLLLIDEALVFFLCGERGSRLPTLMDCAFPFTIAQPYVTTSSDVPIEMFFGRKRERDAVFDLAGTNLVYGGRQLGKTALLRDVVRRYHDPSRGCIVAWVDLKEHHIGISRPASEIWQVIDTVLQQERILPNRERSEASTVNAIASWIENSPHGRIVLLLDEADAFLGQDSRDNKYQTVGKIKGLMERTGRRFKVVFAGLHDVQRASRDINTPLAHFGTPLCIGPLLDNGEVKEAYDLVQRPMMQLGYSFESPDLVSRVLSYANYYPNLIQIFCSHLLDHLNDNTTGRFNSSTCPPYVITSDHIDAALQRRDLQAIIRQRFQITLDLDNRYHIIALVIALETVELRERSEDASHGFEVAWIRENALGWWDRGFEDSSFDAFRTLLDEMVGLGVLRLTGPGQTNYALRSPTIASLLGSRSDIEHVLGDASQKEPVAMYDATSFRRGLRDDLWVRSPLTGQQESDIIGAEGAIVVVFGSSIAGLQSVPSFIEAMTMDKDYLSVSRLPPEVVNRDSFEHALGGYSSGEKSDGVQILVISDELPWTVGWVISASRYLAKRPKVKKGLRIVFLGNGKAAWDWSDPAYANRLPSAITRLNLSRWSRSTLKQWIIDTGIGPCGEAEIQRLEEATGRWGCIVDEAARFIRDNPVQWQQGVARSLIGGEFDEQDCPSEVKDVFCNLAEYGDGLSEVDIAALLETDDIDFVKRVLAWGDSLSFVRLDQEGLWRLNPVIQRVFQG